MAQSWKEYKSKEIECYYKGDYFSAIVWAKEALSQAEVEFGKCNKYYIDDCNSLGFYYQKTGQLDEAEAILKDAIDICKGCEGNDLSYTYSLRSLANLYSEIGNYNESIQLYNKTLEIQSKPPDENTADFAITLNGLGRLYDKLGQFDKAESCFTKAMTILEESIGEQNTSYSTTLNNLGLLYINTGKYGEAERLLTLALETNKKILGESNLDFAVILSNLGLLYSNIGQYEKSESLFERSLKIKGELLGTKNLSYATTLNNLAQIFICRGNLEQALPFFQQAWIIEKEILGESHPDYILLLNNLAGVYQTLHRLDTAEFIYKMVLDTRLKRMGEDNIDYAISLNNLGYLYLEMAKYDDAESSFKKASDIIVKTNSTKHPSYAIILNNLGDVYIRKGQIQNAEKAYVDVINTITERISQGFEFMSERERGKFLITISPYFESYLSFFLNNCKSNQSNTCWPYNIELIQKGIILRSASNERYAILSSKDSNLINEYNLFTNIKTQLAFFYSQPLENQNRDSAYIKELEESANKLEKELVQSSKAYCDVKAIEDLTWENIRDQLTENQAAVEFSSFRFHDGHKWTDSIYYCALILRKGYSQPEMKFLFEQRQLDSILSLNGSDKEVVHLFYSNRGIIIPENLSDKKVSQMLYELVWAPIEPNLSGVDTVYFSPSGSLHKVSFAAIATPDSDCLVNKYCLIQLGSTRQIVKYKTAQDYIDVADSAIVFGGIDYEWAENSNDTATHYSQILPTDDARTHSLSYLPGTLSEAKFIDSLFRKGSMDVELSTGSQATKTVFQNVSGKAPQIIHIATHGFFFPIAEDSRNKDFIGGLGETVYRFSENPLLRSGLLFAGANPYWTGKEEAKDSDNGILTAYEISNMDLSNTKLIVLSACQTGLGDIKGNEGVFGLQRAFKMAGVKNIIMSLWSIPDKETQEFMEIFYGHCFSGESIQNSFTLTQREMKRRYPYDPYKWAGFVLFQ